MAAGLLVRTAGGVPRVLDHDKCSFDHALGVVDALHRPRFWRHRAHAGQHATRDGGSLETAQIQSFPNGRESRSRPGSRLGLASGSSGRLRHAPLVRLVQSFAPRADEGVLSVVSRRVGVVIPEALVTETVTHPQAFLAGRKAILLQKRERRGSANAQQPGLGARICATDGKQSLPRLD